VSLNPSKHLSDRSLPCNLPLTLVDSEVDPLFEEVACDQPTAAVDEHLYLLGEKGTLG
jgi:hypothetical protein